jgi:hypothetical protein
MKQKVIIDQNHDRSIEVLTESGQLTLKKFRGNATLEDVIDYCRKERFEVLDVRAYVKLSRERLAKINNCIGRFPAGGGRGFKYPEVQNILDWNPDDLVETLEKYIKTLNDIFERHRTEARDLVELREQRRAVGEFLRAAMDDAKPETETQE